MVKAIKITLFSLALLSAPAIVSAATLSIIPSNGSFEVGDIITLRATVSSDVSINAVSGKVLISPTFFSIQSISKTGSILDFWVTDPSFDKTSGTMNFEGVALSGFQGSSGTVVVIKVKALKAGSSKVLFQSGQVLANDGEGTDITGDLLGATFAITEAAKKPPVVAPTTEKPAQTAEVVVPPPTKLNAPEISSGMKYGTPSITGTSDYPKTQVLLMFTARDGSRVYIIGATDADGSFNLTIPSLLKAGDYTVSATLVNEDKISSETSNSIVVNVGSAFSDISREVMWAIILLVLAILYLLVRIVMHFKRDKSIHKRIRREAREAEDVAHRSFDVLREDIAGYGDVKSPASRRRTAAEIKKDIDSAEKVVGKEIKDIGSS